MSNITLELNRSRKVTRPLEPTLTATLFQFFVMRRLENDEMSVSILEALMNAEHNLKVGIPAIKPLAMDQLHNAIVLLEKGYGTDTEVEPLLEEFGDVDSVPEAA